MSRLAGQAGRLLHRLVQLALALVVVAACAAGALAWRLGHGPVEVTWLAQRLERAAARGAAVHVAVGHAWLAWAGFADGEGAPVELRLADLSVTDAAGVRLGEAAEVRLSVAAGFLLAGEFVPRGLAVEGARLMLVRGANGRLGLGGSAAGPGGEGDYGGLLRELDRPPGASGGLSQLRRVEIHDAAFDVADRGLGATWHVPSLDVDLARRRQGGVQGHARVRAVLGDQVLELTAEAAGDMGTASALAVRLTPFVPADLARQAAPLARLAAFDGTVALAGELALGQGFELARATLHATVGAGTARIGDGTSAVLGASLDLALARDRLEASLGSLVLAARPDGPKTTVTGHAVAVRGKAGIAVDAVLDLDQLRFADLPALWPAGTGGPGTRPWIVANITDGVATHAHAAIGLDVAADLSEATPRTLAVAMDGHDLTVGWLRPVPPIEHVDGHLSMTDPDAIEIAIPAGHQVGGGLALARGRVRLSGIAGRNQFADIETDLAGPLADLVALLKHPRLKLLDRSPVPLRDVAGQFAGHVAFAHLPLKDSVALDDIAIRAHAHVTGAHLGGVAAGRDLDRGTLDMDASNDGMSLSGRATVASVPAQLGVDLDFRSGPATQVVQKITASATLDARALDGLGVKAEGVVTGGVDVQADAQFQRGGRGDVRLRADFAPAALRLDALGLRKAAGAEGHGEAAVVLDRDRVAAVERVRLSGPGLEAEGRADFAAGQPGVLRVTRLRLGATDLAGELRLPARAGLPTVASVTGPVLDASGYLGRKSEPAGPRAAEGPPGPAFAAEVRVGRVLLDGGAEATGVVARIENDGRITRTAHLEGSLARSGAGGGGVRVDVQPAARGRHLTAQAADAGLLLRGLGVIDDVDGGAATLDANWDDRTPAHRLSGTLDVEGFRVRDAPALGKVLQGMTLYGLVDVLGTGPGLGFNRLVAPFALSGGVLELADARAFSASLGLTVKGSVDLDRRVANVEGTVVPAYFFNTLLTRLPLIGRAFSPEEGGGVFAATYGVHGPFANPSVTVNPLAALTPGFLRGLFDGFKPGASRPGVAAAGGSAGAGGGR